MCYYVSVKEKNQLKNLLPEALKIEDYRQGYFLSGFEHPELPGITAAKADTVQGLIWGIIPEWASASAAAELQRKTLNARSETVFSTPMYRSYATQRCLLLVDGFYEWQHSGKEKIPHFIYRKGRQLMAFGGIYAESPHLQKTTCSIVTTAANPLLSTIHNTKLRMPLILSQKDWDHWLDPKADQTAVERLMVPYAGDDLMAHAIATINPKADNNRPEVQEPVLRQGTLF